MKKTLSLILAVMMLLGCMSITAFAAEPISEIDITVKNFNLDDRTIELSVPDGAGYQINMYQSYLYSFDGAENTVDNVKYYCTLTDENWQDFKSWDSHEVPEPEISADDKQCIRIIVTPLSYNAYPFSDSVIVKVNGNVLTEVAEETFEDGKYWSKYSRTQFAISLDLAAFLVSSGQSDSTDITLKVAKELSYEMVIPEDVDNLNNFGIYAVGQAKVTNVKNATDNTVISYTVETTDFKCEGKSDIPASYYTDSEGATAFPTNAVEVYKNKADAASIPTMYVGISENDYNAAENGTYTATVTFNFSAEDAEAPVAVTAADALVTGAQIRITGIANYGDKTIVGTFENTGSGFTCVSLTDNGADVKGVTYCGCSFTDDIIAFDYGVEYNLRVNINPNNNGYTNSEGTFTKFEVKPAGATEFTEVTLTEAVPG